MNNLCTKTAAILAFIIGAMSFVSGATVLAGRLPSYNILSWLPVYNFVLGLISSFFTATVIWKNHKFAWSAAIATFGAHTLVWLTLITTFRSQVASESLSAMVFRVSVWLVILALMWVQARKKVATVP